MTLDRLNGRTCELGSVKTLKASRQ